MGLSRSTYYHRSREKSIEAKKEEADLRDRIEQIVVEFARYGYRRVTYQLRREGYKVNHKRVARIMREQSLQCQIKRRWVKTTDSNHGYRIYPNLVKGLEVKGRNQVWVADITYIRIRMALEERGSVEGCIHHSDRGVQYACHAYVEELQAAQMRISMARKGNPYDNAAAESFMKTLKYEEVYLWDYQSVEDVKRRLPYFLQAVYNHKRLHSSLGYVTPEEFEQAELASVA